MGEPKKSSSPDDTANIELHVVSPDKNLHDEISPVTQKSLASGTVDEEEFVPQAVEEADPEAKKPEEASSVGILDLFRFATRKEKLLIWVGIFGATVCGVLIPCKFRHAPGYLCIFNEPICVTTPSSVTCLMISYLLMRRLLSDLRRAA